MTRLLLLLTLPLTLACGALPTEQAEPDPGVRAWPLLHVAEEPGKRDVDVLWPLLHVGQRETSTEVDVLWPLVHVGTGDRRDVALRPLFWHTTTDAGTSTVVFPILWRGRSHDSDDFHTALFPVYFRGQSGGDSWFHVWPIAGRHTDGSCERRWVAFPLFGTRTDPERDLHGWDALWPLIAWTREGDQTHVRALPLLWHTFGPDARTTIVFPLWWDLQDVDERFVLLFPLFGRQTWPDFERTFVGGPLYIATRDGDTRTTDVLWPLFHYERSPDTLDLRLIPLLWIERRPHVQRTHVWPFYGESRHQAFTETTVAWPLFSYYDYAAGGYRLHAPAPLLMLERRPNRRETTVFPLFSVETRQTKEGPHTRWWIVGPLSWGHRDPESADLRVLWKLFQKTERADGSRVFAINPFWHTETKADGTETWSVLLGLYGQATRGDTTRHRLLWFIRW